MKTKKFFFMLGMALTCMFNMTSCDDAEDFNPEVETQSIWDKDTKTPGDLVVVSFENITSDDQVTLAADTSYIMLDDYYLIGMGKTLQKGDYVDVWLAPNEAAFASKVIGTQRPQGSHYCKYMLQPASFAEILPEGSYTLDMDPYINPAEALRTADGHINGSAYYNAQDDTYHPVAYSLVDQKLQNSETEKYCPLPFAEWKSPLVEDQLTRNGAIEIKFIDATANTSLSIPVGDGWGSIGFEKIHAEAYAGMQFRLDVGSNNFIPYIDAFEASARGALNFKVDASMQFGKAFPLWDKEFPLFTFGHYIATFCIGPVPVTVDCNPQICLTTSAKAQGKFKFSTSYECGFDLQAGVGYYHNHGWENLSHAEGKSEYSAVKPLFYGQVNANVGLMLCVPFKVYGCVGPTFSAGPQLRGSFTGTADVKSHEIKGSGVVELAVGGKVGAELSIFGIKLVKWEASVDLWTKQLFHETWTQGADSDEAKQMIDEAEEYRKQREIPEGVPVYYLHQGKMGNCMMALDPSYSYIEWLCADPARVAALNDGHNLQVGDYVKFCYDFSYDYDILRVTSAHFCEKEDEYTKGYWEYEFECLY